MFVALDVGGSSIKSGCVTASAASGQLIGVGDVVVHSLDHTAGRAVIVATFVAAIGAASSSVDPAGGAVERIAVAVPDPFNHHDGVSLMQHKFAALYGVRLGDQIARALDEVQNPVATVPIRWCNDAAAALAGEAASGAASGVQRVFGVTLGTGLGAAFIVAGQLVERVAGYTIPETYLLRTGSGLTADEWLSARAFVERAEHGGSPEEFGTDLGEFLDPIASAISADIVVVGGGGLASYSQFAPALQAHMTVPVVAAQLDRWAPLIGAVALTNS